MCNKMCGKFGKYISLPCLLLSKLALILAAYGAFTKNDIWLAPTQWLLVAGLLAIYSVYYKCCCGGETCCK